MYYAIAGGKLKFMVPTTLIQKARGFVCAKTVVWKLWCGYTREKRGDNGKLTTMEGKMQTIELKEGQCVQCGKKRFVAQNHTCLECVAKNIKDGKYDKLIKDRS